MGCALSREDGSFLIRQFVLPSFAAEKALIGAVSEWARAEAAVLVTYNGRTFDVPVMETRWAFHRLRSPWDELPHLDMLHVARRLWSKKHGRDPERAAWDAPEDTSGCRLVHLERTLFEVERVGDVPGYEIPGRYFDFVRRGDWSVLEPVLHHNRLDLLSLAGVTARAARLLRTGVSACTRAEEAALLGRELHRRVRGRGGRSLLSTRAGRSGRGASAAGRHAGRPGPAVAQPAPLRRRGGVLDGDHRAARRPRRRCGRKPPRPWRCTSSTVAATWSGRTATPSGPGTPS